MSFTASAFHKDQRWRFKERLNALHEERGVKAIHHAVMEARRKVHHLAGNEYRPVPDGTHHHLVDADNRDLGMVDDGGGHHAAHGAERRNGDSGACLLYTSDAA